MFLKLYKNPHQNLQVPFDHEKFGSTPNLLNAVSREDLNKQQSSELPSKRHEEKSNKAKLEKRKSRSLSNLHVSEKVASDYSILNRSTGLAVWNTQDSGTSGSPLQTVHPQSSSLLEKTCESHSEWTIDKLESEEDRPRKDSGFDEHPSPGISDASSHGDTPPPIPQRPSLQEINSRCTTITRRAVLQPHI